MQFLASLRLRTESATRDTLTAELVRLEISRVHDLLGSGTIRQAWKKLEGVAIVLLVEVPGEEECRAVLATLPFSQAGVLDVEMIVAVEPYLDAFPGSPQE